VTGTHHGARPPRIGLSSCFLHPEDRPFFKYKTLLYVEQSMAHWIASGGAIVYPVPTLPEGGEVTLDQVVADLDGLVLHGGADVAPASYGEAELRPEWAGDAVRDAYEVALVRAFLDADKPVLGICRGHQVINVALGGTLFQDLREQGATDRIHRDADAYDRNEHALLVEDGSALAGLVGGGRHRINSVHHQGIKDVAPGLCIEARSADDGVIEAVRLADGSGRWCAGVQWHPEFVRPIDTHLLDDTPLRAEFLTRAIADRDRVGRPATPSGPKGAHECGS
jgi:putative glutamine amidotransferase